MEGQEEKRDQRLLELASDLQLLYHCMKENYPFPTSEAQFPFFQPYFNSKRLSLKGTTDEERLQDYLNLLAEVHTDLLGEAIEFINWIQKKLSKASSK